MSGWSVLESGGRGGRAVALGLTAMVLGCDGRDRPRPPVRQPDSVETTASMPPGESALATVAASKPASRPTSERSPQTAHAPPRQPASDTASQPAVPGLPKLPAFLEIVSTVHANLPAKVEVLRAADDVVALATENVERLRVLRNELPFTPGRSVILRLDGQAIEWSARSATVELVRGRTGAWAAAAGSASRPATRPGIGAAGQTSRPSPAVPDDRASRP